MAPRIQNRAIDGVFKLPNGWQVWVQHKTEGPKLFEVRHKAPYDKVDLFLLWTIDKRHVYPVPGTLLLNLMDTTGKQNFARSTLEANIKGFEDLGYKLGAQDFDLLRALKSRAKVRS